MWTQKWRGSKTSLFSVLNYRWQTVGLYSVTVTVCLRCGSGQNTSSTSQTMSSVAKHRGKYRPLLVLLLLFLLHLLLFLLCLFLLLLLLLFFFFCFFSCSSSSSSNTSSSMSFYRVVLQRCVHQRANLTPVYGDEALISVWSDWLHVSSHVHVWCFSV